MIPNIHLSRKKYQHLEMHYSLLETKKTHKAVTKIIFYILWFRVAQLIWMYVFIFHVLFCQKLRRPWKTIKNQGNTFAYPSFESENEPVIFPKVWPITTHVIDKNLMPSKQPMWSTVLGTFRSNNFLVFE